MRTRLPALLVSLAFSGCGADSPMGPETSVVHLRYVAATEAVSCATPEAALCAASCGHHNAPANLTVSSSWGESARLTPCGDAQCVVMRQVPVDTAVSVLLLDIRGCCRDCSAAVHETVYANGKTLVRFQDEPLAPGQAGGLVFTVDRRGIVTP